MLLGEILIADNHLLADDLDKALHFQVQYGGLLGSVLVNMGIISEDVLVATLANQLKVKTFIDIDRTSLDFTDLDIPKSLNLSFLLDRHWLPLSCHNNEILFVAQNPLDYEVSQYLYDNSICWQSYIVTESQYRYLEGQ